MLSEKLISGIICEYNPFHSGHKYQIDKIKEESDSLIVCVMSGNFVQRGEPSVIDKYSRVEMALIGGADLVIELPVAFATASAEAFGECAVYLLDALGVVDRIYFGSESSDINKLDFISGFLLSDKYSAELGRELKGGVSFPIARMNAVNNVLGENYSELLQNPNDILGIEYIKSIKKLNSKIEPHTIKRVGSAHDKADDLNFISAKSIRELLKDNKDVSEFVPYPDFLNKVIKNGQAPTDLRYLERTLLYKIRNMNESQLRDIPDVGEGLEFKIKKAAATAKNLDELYELIKSKRYTHSRIRRILLRILLDIDKEKMNYPKYIRVLGMNKSGEEILRSKQNKFPFVLRYNEVKKLGYEQQGIYELEAKADDIYSLTQPIIGSSGSYYSKSVIKK